MLTNINLIFRRHRYLVFSLSCLITLLLIPRTWLPDSWQPPLYNLFGPPSSFQISYSETDIINFDIDIACPEDLTNFNHATIIEDVEIERSQTCISDNPYSIAAFVKGTNNVSMETLRLSGLTSDAVTKEDDLDGDGDPDVIHIKLEVVELNGYSTVDREPSLEYEIAPGIHPGFWVFAPKMVGHPSENFESNIARQGLRLPSPPIRIEQGDKVYLTLENGHSMPHTIHLHGIDHAYINSEGEGNDGVPTISEMPVMPGESKTYEINSRISGFGLYHCHVQPQAHIMMGLQGLFIVEENRPNNWLQTLNIGAGQVRARSTESIEKYDQEIDLHYLDLDSNLNNIIQAYNDPRLIAESMNREFNMTQVMPNFFTLNGLSFPYTFRDSLINVHEDELIKLRVANGGVYPVAFHIHGHRPKLTHLDGIPLATDQQIMRDVFSIDTAQRIELDLSTQNDGLNSSGPGVWLYHDHKNQGVTNNGIGPGGHISAITYNTFSSERGWPKLNGMDWGKFFTEEYYSKDMPIWAEYAPALASVPNTNFNLIFRLLLLGFFSILTFYQLILIFTSKDE